jgi:hypothetical protein
MTKLSSRHVIGLFMAVAVLLVVSGCTAKNTTTNTKAATNANPAAVTNTVNANVGATNTTNSSATFSACQIYSQTEAEAIIGTTLNAPDPATGRINLSAYDNTYSCTYTNGIKGSGARTVYVEIDRFGSSSTARGNFDTTKLRISMSLDVTGLGDAAYWDRDQNFLRVIRGSDIFTTQVLSGLNGSQAKATTIMNLLLTRVK